MKSLLLPSLLICVCALATAAQEKLGTVAGRVTESLSGQPVANALVASGASETRTDADGAYKLDLPPGEYNLRVTADGFGELLTLRLTVTASRVFVQNIELAITPQKENVEVTSSVFATTEDLPLSQNSLSRDEIRNTPGSAGDILRSIGALPSVTSAGAEFGDYFVRGGKTDENLVFIDNIPVGDFTLFSDKYDNGKGGRGAILPSDVIDRADFSAGGFGVRYGDKMSSVLDVALRESNRDRVQAVIFADLGNAGGSIDIPFGDKGGWVSSVRRSYIDVVFDTFDLGDFGRPRNWDFINKGVYDLNARNKLSVTAVNTFEKYTLNVAQASGSDRRTDRLETERRSRRAIFGATLTTAVGDSTLSRVTAWLNGQHSDGSLRRVDPARTLQRNRDLRDLQIGIKEELTAVVSPRVQFAAGGGIYFDRANYYSFERSGIGFSPLEEEFFAPDRSNRLNTGTLTSAYGYGQLTWKPTARFSVTPGLRVDRYGATGETVASPRAAARFAVTNKIFVNFAAGIYRQPPSFFTLSLTPANRGLKSQRATHLIGGVEWLALEDLRVRAEFFRKRYDNLTVQPVPGNYNYANTGSGTADGAEISMQKALRGRWAGQLSYSYVRSRRRLNDGGFAFPADEDRPHQFTAIGITKIWFDITLAAKYRYASGLPYDARTPVRLSPTVSVFLQRLARVEDRNARRLERYSNLDFRVEKKFDFKRLSFAPYLDMFNVFAADNVTQVNYEFGRRTPEFLEENARLPIFGLRIEF